MSHWLGGQVQRAHPIDWCSLPLHVCDHFWRIYPYASHCRRVVHNAQGITKATFASELVIGLGTSGNLLSSNCFHYGRES
jgi:hypothetical protein